MKYWKISAFFLLIFFSTLFSEENFKNVEQFRQFASEQMKIDKIPGMTIGFIDWKDGEKIWVEAFGFSDLENQVPAQIHSAYRLASVSKPITAVAVLKLVEQGKLDLNAEIQTYVPYFPKKKWPVRVGPILGHLGGISHYQDYEVEGRIREEKNTREAIAIFEAFDLESEPGTKYVYSSYGFNLLAAAVEGASGRSFSDYMQENVWTPLGMPNTRLDDPDDLIPHRVRGYRIVDGEIKNSEFVNVSSRLGGGGARSTIPDLLRFAKGLNEGKAISAKSLDRMLTSMTTRDGRYTDYGMGIGSDAMNGRFFAAHTGSQPETRTVFYMFPARKLAIAAAINQEDASPSVYARQLYQTLTGERWNLSGYVVDRQNTMEAIESIFNRGMAYFDRYRKPMTTDAADIKKAMKYFQQSVGKNQASRKMREDGHNPAAGEPFTKIGSYIAYRLYEKHNDSIFDRYAIEGAIPFFKDYLQNKDKQLKFDGPFTRDIDRWNQSWVKTNTAKTRAVKISSQTGTDADLQNLKSAFAGKIAYPDFSSDIASMTLDLILEGKSDQALNASKTGVDLYNQSTDALAAYGATQILYGESKAGVELIKKAAAIDSEGAASSESLSEVAYEIAETGRVSEAIKLVTAAIEVHPKAAHLYSDLGEAYTLLKDYKKAVESFHKAIELDPENEDAKKKLQEISKYFK